GRGAVVKGGSGVAKGRRSLDQRRSTTRPRSGPSIEFISPPPSSLALRSAGPCREATHSEDIGRRSEALLNSRSLGKAKSWILAVCHVVTVSGRRVVRQGC